MKKITLLLWMFVFLFLVACDNTSETLKIEYDKDEIVISVGEEKDLQLPNNVVAVVDLNEVLEYKDGKVLGLKAGEIIITLKLKDDEKITKTLTVKVVESTYTITYDLDGGTCEDLVETFKDYKEASLKTPTKEGFAFDGWYEGDKKIESISENRNYNLKAKWTEAKPQEIKLEYKHDYEQVYFDDQIKLTYNVLPQGCDQTITWKVTPRTFGRVDENGVLTFDKGGNYEITAISEADSDIKAKITIEVKDYRNPYRFMDSIQVKEISAKPVTSFQSTHNTETFVLGSVVYFLFEEVKVIENMVPEGKVNRPGKVSTSGIPFVLKYVTVHDVGFTGSAQVTSNNCVNSSSSTSWHYSIGNDGVYQSLPLDEVGYHAGDGTSVALKFTDTGIKAPAGDDTPAVVTINQTTGVFEMNGQQTTIKAPLSEWGTIVKNEQLPYTGINNYVDPETGTYWISNTHWDKTYDTLGNYGGNLNSIGIETSVLEGSNLYYTWELTAKTIATKILKPKGLLPRDVKQHNTFSGKDCPMTMRHANMWEEFMKHVEGEYYAAMYYPTVYGWTFEFSSDSEYLKPNGMVDHLPDQETEVSYSITMSNGKDFTHTFTYTIKLPAKSAIEK